MPGLAGEQDGKGGQVPTGPGPRAQAGAPGGGPEVELDKGWPRGGAQRVRPGLQDRPHDRRGVVGNAQERVGGRHLDLGSGVVVAVVSVDYRAGREMPALSAPGRAAPQGDRSPSTG